VELKHILRALRRRFWIPLVLVALTGLVTGALYLKAKPTYTATASVIAKNPTNGTDRPLNFAEVAMSNATASRALKDANVDMPIADLQQALAVVSGKSDIYQISVRDGDPNRAVALANAVATESTSFYEELATIRVGSATTQINKDIAEMRTQYLAAAEALATFEAQHPETVAGRGTAALLSQRQVLLLEQQAAATAFINLQTGVSQTEIGEISRARDFAAGVVDKAVAAKDAGLRADKVAYAQLVALLLGIALVIALEYLTRTVRDPTEVEEILGVPVIGFIPKANSRVMKRAARAS
jgi:capsular polysaccharide biosynthesis protein